MNKFAIAAAFAVLAPAASFAGTYDALCGGARCSILIDEQGIHSPTQHIPSGRVTKWTQAGSSSTDIATGLATTVVFGPLGLLGFAAQNHDYNFVVNGFDEDGKKASIQFQFINKKPVPQVAADLSNFTGLGVNQVRTEEEILANEKSKGNLVAMGTRLGDGLKKQVVAQAAKPCWGEYLNSNPAMGVWANANPTLAEAQRVKSGYDLCKAGA